MCNVKFEWIIMAYYNKCNMTGIVLKIDISYNVSHIIQK